MPARGTDDVAACLHILIDEALAAKAALTPEQHAQAREALQPFGDLADAHARIYHTDKDDVAMFHIREASLTAGMLRRAARVLSEGGKDGC